MLNYKRDPSTVKGPLDRLILTVAQIISGLRTREPECSNKLQPPCWPVQALPGCNGECQPLWTPILLWGPSLTRDMPKELCNGGVLYLEGVDSKAMPHLPQLPACPILRQELMRLAGTVERGDRNYGSSEKAGLVREDRFPIVEMSARYQIRLAKKIKASSQQIPNFVQGLSWHVCARGKGEWGECMGQASSLLSFGSLNQVGRVMCSSYVKGNAFAFVEGLQIVSQKIVIQVGRVPCCGHVNSGNPRIFHVHSRHLVGTNTQN